MWRTQSCKRRNKGHTAAVGNAGCQRLDFMRMVNDVQLIAQPLYHRAADEDAAFECVTDFITDLPRNRGEQIVG